MDRGILGRFLAALMCVAVLGGVLVSTPTVAVAVERGQVATIGSGVSDLSVSNDGAAIAFVSSVPAQNLVTDPSQVGAVTDNNTGSGGTDSGDDVFVYRQLSTGSTISLISWNLGHTGTGNAPSTSPVMARDGLGLAFSSKATNLVTGTVAAGQTNLYAWVPGLSATTSVFLVDNKFGSMDACACEASDPSISLSPSPTVVFDASSAANDLAGAGVTHQDEDQVYAHNVSTGTNSLVSVDTSGDGVVGGADDPMIAADAAIVVFDAIGDGLKSGFNSSNGMNIWTRNLLTSTTSLVSGSASGDPHGTSGNQDPVISDSGTVAAWASNDSDASATPFFTPTQLVNHVFYRVISPAPQPTVMVDTDHTGVLGCDSDSSQVGLSGNGKTVVFQSDCDDATSVTDTNSAPDVFARTMSPIAAVSPTLVSVKADGTGSATGGATLSAGNQPISSDGDTVAFLSGATNVPSVGFPHLPSGVTTRAIDASATASAIALSADGGTAAYVSSAGAAIADLHNHFSFQPVSPVDEGSGSVTVTVSRTGDDASTDSVEVSTSDGSAAAPGDYTAVDKTLTFSPGVTAQTFEVPIVDDNNVESTETFHVNMTAGSTGIGVPGPPADVQILDNDSVAVTINQATGQADPAATAPIVFTVVVSAPASAFGAADVNLSGSSAGGALHAAVTGGPTDFTVDVTGMTSGGTVLATVPASTFQDNGGRSNSASTSTDNTVTWRINPSITAKVSSAHPKSAAGWFRSPVTVSFTCTPHTAPLSGACPAKATVGANGRGQVVKRTVTATDGGQASLQVTINLDRTAPTIRIKRGARPRCVATDRLSGVASCHLTKHIKRVHGHRTVSVSARATDKAGNVASKHVTYRL